MKHTRIIVTHYGGPDALQVVEDECPEPKDGEARVRVLDTASAPGLHFGRRWRGIGDRTVPANC